MTVKELIKILQQEDPDKEVVVDDGHAAVSFNGVASAIEWFGKEYWGTDKDAVALIGGG